MKVLIIIPAYNEEACINTVISELKKEIKKMPYSIDYIVINDCSKDNTLKILKNEEINYLSLPINLGIGGCVQSGYIYAIEQGYDIAVQMDGDGQHDPRYLKNIIDPLVNGKADLVVGSRFVENEGFQSSQFRRMGIKILSRTIQLVCGEKIKDVTSGFRAANRDVISLFTEDYAQDYPEPESIVLCSKNNYRIKEVPVTMKERQGGQSSISPIKSVYYMIKVTIAILFSMISTSKK